MEQRTIRQLVSVNEAARMLGVHPNTLRAWSDSGRVTCVRINARGDRRYHVADLRAFLDVGSGRAMPERGQPRSSAGVVSFVRRPAAPSPAAIEPGDGGHDGATAAPAGAQELRRLAAAIGRRPTELLLLRRISEITAGAAPLDDALREIAALLRESLRYRAVAFFAVTGGGCAVRAADGGSPDAFAPPATASPRVLRAISTHAAVLEPDLGAADDLAPGVPWIHGEAAVPILIGDRAWGALDVLDDRRAGLSATDVELLETVANQVAVMAHNLELIDRVRRQLEQAEALRRIAGDITSTLDLGSILAELIEHALSLFGADHGAVFLRRRNGTYGVEVASSVADMRMAAVRELPDSALAARALAERAPIVAADAEGTLRVATLPRAARREGVHTIAVAPLFAGEEVLGLLALYHDAPHPYDPADVDAMGGLAAQVSVAIKNARNYAQMAQWAAQLRSIQQLGARLNRLTTVRDIALGIVNELQLLISSDNVRVYRAQGAELVPVAWRGQTGEYTTEDVGSLRVRVGQGITGWVAENAIAQYLPDAANDARTEQIPGTREDLDESMLVAPMTFESQVLGVISLSKLGLGQFGDDDLRLLAIYASFAAQAMANADATERLQAQSERLGRQVRSQRELLEVSESILTTLDPRIVLEQVADRLTSLVSYDNLAIRRWDADRSQLVPLLARGPHADAYGRPVTPVHGSLSEWVLSRDEGQLVREELEDSRVVFLPGIEPHPGSLIVTPLRGWEGPVGSLVLERLGGAHPFSDDEFDLVKLFAAQASIALRNAEVHRAVEIRAERDALTGLRNHGTFQQELAAAVDRREPFSVLMIDLDNFKAYNDTYGHQAGDAKLGEIARHLEGSVRDSDRVYRYGGDEFALLLPRTDDRGALSVAAKVLAAVAGPLREESGPRITCSAGVATYPADGTDPASIILAADRACYASKRLGRNRLSPAADGLRYAGELVATNPTPVDAIAASDEGPAGVS